MEERLLTVKNIMRRDIPVIDKDDTLSYAIRLMQRYDIDRVLAVEDGKLVGIMSKRDIMVRLATLRTKDASLSRLYVSSLMSENPLTVSPKTLVDKAIRVMVENNIGSLPVVMREEILGLVTRFEILQLLFNEDINVTDLMRPIPTTLTPTSSILHARQELLSTNSSILPVVNSDGKIIGYVMTDNVVDALVDFYENIPPKYRGDKIGKLLVRDFMRRTPILVKREESLGATVRKILEKKVKGVFMCDEHLRPVGILTLKEILKYISISMKS